jgi:hypothetical protein
MVGAPEINPTAAFLTSLSEEKGCNILLGEQRNARSEDSTLLPENERSSVAGQQEEKSERTIMSLLMCKSKQEQSWKLMFTLDLQTAGSPRPKRLPRLRNFFRQTRYHVQADQDPLDSCVEVVHQLHPQ